jgi:hypothetical protein
MNRRAPNLDETPAPIDEDTRAQLEHALRSRMSAPATPVHVEGRHGAKAAVLVAVIGAERHAHELFVFSRAPVGVHAMSRCIDYLDGIVKELARSHEKRFLPLDWEGRPYAGGIVFVRGEVRDYVAEEPAAQLLDEAAPARALGSVMGSTTT